VAPALHRTIAEVAAAAAKVVRGPADAGLRKSPRPSPLVPDPRLAQSEPQLPELDALCDAAVVTLAKAGFTKVDYVAVREAESLKVVSRRTERPLRVLAAATLGSTRLIDNVPA
jgi:pantoate--beta-alanine ligase